MSVPNTRHDMLRAGYKLLSVNGPRSCKACQSPMEWWLTTNGKKTPFNLGGEHEPAITHWATCPAAKDFKGKAATPPVPHAADKSLEAEANRILDRFQARVVVVIDNAGHVAAWRNGLSGEELRSDLIAAGNFVRSEILKGAAKS